MRSSLLLDRGNEKMVIYPEIRTVDSRNNSQVTHSSVPVTRRVFVTTDRQSDAELTGQLAVKILKVSMRTVPGMTSFAKVWFRGEYWDLAKPETISRQTRALRHSEYVLRSRNQVGPDPTLPVVDTP